MGAGSCDQRSIQVNPVHNSADRAVNDLNAVFAVSRGTSSRCAVDEPELDGVLRRKLRSLLQRGVRLEITIGHSGPETVNVDTDVERFPRDLVDAVNVIPDT